MIDSEASQTGGRFVRTCNAFGLPLVVLVDTPRFLPGSSQEVAGHGQTVVDGDHREASTPR